ncbi:putative c6 zinc finger domain-containing protein [Phaeoacremonium minimum UCRPA7]|uniref:Putative c6 zinc finger domain-containing protein n=1 Tax=Phaeoacremonium minimum (strain UCR-PA7) TaxID=1286976 RepID=R8BP47_PHAM7|nr:putative c6 zinc finger domain-containing protein [Phaeoacremonium minimum UCRPA7]EOO01104.1 putative c6 zinc finger domain-containing protein [Phaeoacremonium minimum UCRPA7]
MAPTAVATPVLLEPNFNGGVFDYQWEKVYFDHWLALANNMGGGFFKSDLWTRTIPQLSRDEPAIRYAGMAIGAMANAMSPNMLPKTFGALLDNGPHYKNALTYYGRALRHVRLQQGPNPESALRAAILSCILFVCFETLHGNREAALHHISHGLQMMEAFLKSKTPPDVEDPTTEFLTHSPAPYVIEDEILQVFQRFDFQSWSTGLLRPKRTNNKTPHTQNRVKEYPVHKVPESFADLDEARQWWDLVQHWVLQFPRTVVIQLVREIERVGPEAAQKLDMCDVPGVRDLQRHNLELLERWNAAFWPLYNARRHSKRADEEGYLRAVSLQIQYLVAWMSTRSICFSEYETMYQLTPQFREINRLGAVLLPRQPKAGGCSEAFTMDNGPTMALLIVASKCRDVDVREEAIALMEKYPRRDGFWDSRAMVALAKYNRDIEQENETEGDLYEQWARLRQREAIIDERNPEMMIFMYRKDPKSGQFQMQQHLLRW